MRLDRREGRGIRRIPKCLSGKLTSRWRVFAVACFIAIHLPRRGTGITLAQWQHSQSERRKRDDPHGLSAELPRGSRKGRGIRAPNRRNSGGRAMEKWLASALLGRFHRRRRRDSRTAGPTVAESGTRSRDIRTVPAQSVTCAFALPLWQGTRKPRIRPRYRIGGDVRRKLGDPGSCRRSLRRRSRAAIMAQRKRLANSAPRRNSSCSWRVRRFSRRCSSF